MNNLGNLSKQSSVVPPDSSTILLTLSDQSGIAPTSGAAWVAGFINGGASNLQILQSDGSFTAPAAPTVVSVAATSAWQGTGIQITQGSLTTNTVAYVSGKWTADPQTNGGNLYDANGCPGLNVPTDQTAFPMVGVAMGALVGKIGETGTPFFIGDGYWFSSMAQTSGELYLCINDDLTGVYGAGLTDNSGSLTVEITEGLPFYLLSSIPVVTVATQTNGANRLIFVVSPSQPPAMPIAVYSPLGYTAYPYANPPGIAAPGPFDIFEFGMDAAADLSAVNGLGLNLSFSYNSEQYGVNTTVSRQQVGNAYSSFITKEGNMASPFAQLLYQSSIGNGAPNPPAVSGNEFFAIADPNDLLQALLIQGDSIAADNALASYWDSTLASFFGLNQYLSINLGGNNIYSGQCQQQTNPSTGILTNAYTLTNSSNTSYTFYQPPAGIESALYVFEQAFNPYTPAGPGGDAGLLQDCIWEALCRGVATAGVFAAQKTAGESTQAWNTAANWYAANSTCHYYAKFLHCSDVNGEDFRTSGQNPIFYGGAAYGFSMDENPIGPGFSGNVPSKTKENVPGGSVISIVLGPWST